MRVLVTQPFGEAQLDRIRAADPRLAVTRAEPGTADYRGVEVLYTGAPPRDLARAPDLRWIQLHMAGVNALLDHPVFHEPRIALTTASGVHTVAVAEYAFAVLLALTHPVPRMVEWHARKTWPPDEERWPLFVPAEIRGATLGVIGYGSIGRELARIATAAFGMTVLACKRDPATRTDSGYGLPGTGDPAGVLPSAWFGPAELRHMLPRCDVVALCAPLTPATRGLVDAAAIAAMKPTAYLVNVGRGATVDEAALARALASGRLAGAAIDVFAEEPPPASHPFYALDNVILSPHVSGFLPSYDDRCAQLFAENLRRYLAGAPLLNLVDRARGY
ncbi:MAG TPA: D-2-hydroxyacid dehydrogenase [Methylomirabilota bacterium]|nr:D-2-hydroxyacid dehydrogenase [Methylomirabilota bacterium]